MAIYHFTTKIVKASKGKCAVASAAYQAAEKLYDERLGESFSYTHKEEVVHSEIMLPKYAPEHLKDRATLWNEVEKIQSKSNARYARQFEFSLPVEWTREECIERARDFIQKNFVDKGMIVDWAFHDKPGNPHIHMMCTTRGFNQDGSWASVSKSVYALDADGNKIPDIDPATGLQKVRVRKGKGEEKLWVRVNNPTNDWNRRDTLIAWRKAWSEYANQYLSKDNQIDHRSYKERRIEKVPGIHILPGMTDEENQERYQINSFFESGKRFLEEAKIKLEAFKKIVKERFYGEGRGYKKDGISTRTGSIAPGISGVNGRDITASSHIGRGSGASTREDNIIGIALERVQAIRERLSGLVARNRTFAATFGTVDDRKRDLEEISRRTAEVRERRLMAYDRAEYIRRMLLDGVGATSNPATSSGTTGSVTSEGYRTETETTEDILRKVRDAADDARVRITDSRASRADREAEWQRYRTQKGYGASDFLSGEGGATHKQNRGPKH